MKDAFIGTQARNYYELKKKVLEGSVDSQFGIGDDIWEDYTHRGADAGGNLKIGGANL